MTSLSDTPPVSSASSTAVASNLSKTASSEATASESSSTVPEEKPVTQPTVQATIPDGAYYANVTWPQGLSLRAEPSIDAQRIGGIGYDAKILILENSQDKKWQKVQLPWNKQEGWVKAGNVKRVSD